MYSGQLSWRVCCPAGRKRHRRLVEAHTENPPQNARRMAEEDGDLGWEDSDADQRAEV